jgi:predicted N-formylglutamate amidohydrolase
MKMILTCEHAVGTVPEEYTELFAGAPHVLETHRGHDIGARSVCRCLEDLAEAAFYGGCSRLLIDLNRSLHHPRLFSAFSNDLSRDEKERIVADWYRPFRQAVRQSIKENQGRYGEVLHLSVHSFTPVLGDAVRTNDIGILYNPGRRREKELARRLAAALLLLNPQLKIRMNSPYRGVADGHTTALRRSFAETTYLGIELEINQRLLEDERGRATVGRLLFLALPEAAVGN